MMKAKTTQPATQSKESGFTIIESLIAIIVVSILMIGLAPVITLAVATRVQARRVEQATRAARSYVDAVNSGAIEAPTVMVKDNINVSTDGLVAVSPPSGSFTCSQDNAYCTTPANLYCIDLDSDGKCTSQSPQDLVVQTFAAISADGTTSVDVQRGYRSYRLGVRVYRAYAFDGEQFPKPEGQKQSSFGVVVGGDKLKLPLVETTTQIVVNDKTEYSDLCTKAGVNGC
ncbi:MULTISPECIES: hormogonium polysaccharide secretion pseudopilin HpsB [unclassified Coleofasciculus]|uniref:hormogonium polysaccharide secretion pseudopilin HpsB n=1 Tax=unclassified Coleofasciculus TaxID=2692782 RepID=UPI001880AFE3|nr:MULTISPECIES: hormogonium polysaccharide secretion pseudopilin HpsB [unclassified Coleofasciculus]MBE9126702.1 type II secretion system protein [Coleofasciculus sp. LEGE 07081]MBE9150062.1 type II secretion system protein [Coleofasciculus sp. LEGE 07092]